jgi:GT2 family glycosyltransferase
MERYDAFVVDNASTDDTLSILHAEYPKAIVRAMDKNLGFGQANNIGLRYALDNGYDYVFLLNQDAWLLLDTIDKLIAAQKQHPEYWVLSPLQMNTAQGGVEKQFGVYCKKNKVQLNLDVPQQVDFVNAALWLIPIECIKIVGGFDPIFPHYGEDTDFLQRVTFYKGKIGILPIAKAYHERSEQVTQSEEKKIYTMQLVYMGILKNINHSMLLCICQLFLYVLIRVSKCICRLQFSKIRIYLRALVKLHGKYAEIKKRRNLTRVQPMYL